MSSLWSSKKADKKIDVRQQVSMMTFKGQLLDPVETMFMPEGN